MTPSEQYTELAKTAPPLAVTGVSILGMPISEWVLYLTAIYALLQIVISVHRYLVYLKIVNKDPACAEDCPVARRRKAGEE